MAASAASFATSSPCPLEPFVPFAAQWIPGLSQGVAWFPRDIDPTQGPLGSSLRLRLGGLLYDSTGGMIGAGVRWVFGRSMSSTADPGPDALIYTPPTPPFGDPLQDTLGQQSPAFTVPLETVA